MREYVMMLLAKIPRNSLTRPLAISGVRRNKTDELDVVVAKQ